MAVQCGVLCCERTHLIECALKGNSLLSEMNPETRRCLIHQPRQERTAQMLFHYLPYSTCILLLRRSN